MAREQTVHGHDTRCGLCGLRVYGLWVSKEPPPFGCANGLDATPWGCSFVIASLQAAAISIDHMGGTLQPHHHQIISIIGTERANAIMDHCREHNAPPKSMKRREPDYSAPARN